MMKLLQVCLAVCISATFVNSVGANSAPATCSSADIDKTGTTMITSLKTFERMVYFFHSADERLAAGLQRAVIESYSLQNENLTSILTQCRGGNASQSELTFVASKDGAIKVYGFPVTTSVGEIIHFDCGDNIILSQYCVFTTTPKASVENYWTVISRNTLVQNDKITKCKARVKNAAVKWVNLNPQLGCDCASKTS